MILLEMMLELVIGVMVMEVDKMADEVTDMEVYKVTDMKIHLLTWLWRLVILTEMMLEVDDKLADM